MTLNQFQSLNIYLNSFDTVDEILKTPKFHNLKKRNNVNTDDVKNLIFNGWNSERVLRVSSQLFNSQENHFVLQWSFPQSYYSVFQLTLSFMYLKDIINESHKPFIKKFGEFVKLNRYPKMISFYCDGTKKNPIFENISFQKNINSIDFDPNSIESCETQICQFLKSTRDFELDKKRDNKEIRKKYITVKGKEKNNLNEKEWNEISNGISVTNILHLLYRKRIKSNYLDIDTFTSGENKSKKIHESLIGIVNNLNLIHECYIYKMIGRSKFMEFYYEFTKQEKIPFLEERVDLIKKRIN